MWISLSVHPVFGPDGEALESRSVAIDISERKAAEARIERLAAFPRHNPDPVVQLAADGSVRYANEACLRAVERMGATDPEALLPEGSEAVVAECLESGIGHSDLRVTLDDRTLAWVYHPIQPAGVVHCYAFDVTLLDEQLRHLQKMEAVGRFSGGIAHDFNNLLSVVLANCGLLKRSLSADSEALTSVEDIEEAAKKGAALVDSLMAFSRRQRLSFSDIDLGEVVQELEPTLALLLSEDITISVQVSSPGLVVRADPAAVEQMVLNLVVNAADAMFQGGVVVLDVSGRSGSSVVDPGGQVAFQGELAVISVRDEGVGIPRELRQKVFEPFFSTKGAENGSGLGLAMVHGLMQQHGGQVRIDSELGKGTTVELVFPLFETSERSGGRTSKEAPTAQGGLETLLLVDDEEALRRAGKRTLERLGYRVFVAADGFEAEELLDDQDGRIDLVITDVVMPRCGGHELLERARERWPELPFLFTSGYSSKEWGDGVGPTSDVRLLPKPWTLEELSAAVRATLHEAAKERS